MAEELYKALSLLFRIAALGLSVAAAIAMVTASQVVIVGGGDGGAESSSYSTISYTQYNTLRYFVAGVAISGVCSAAALYLFAVRADVGVLSLPLVPCLDAAAQGFLFSAASAAFAARDLVGVCDVAGAFCGRVTVAAAVCAVAAVAVAVAALTRDVGQSSARKGGGVAGEW